MAELTFRVPPEQPGHMEMLATDKAHRLLFILVLISILFKTTAPTPNFSEILAIFLKGRTWFPICIQYM